MLNNGKKILPDLKDHEVQPPSFLFDKIKQRIEEEEDAAFKKLFAGLGNHSISPKEELFNEGIEPKIHLTNHLKALKDHKIAPPLQFEKILSGAKNLPQQDNVFSLKNYSRRIAAAVAVIILGGASYFIYQNGQSNKSGEGIKNTPIAETRVPSEKKPAVSDTISTAPVAAPVAQGSKTSVASVHITAARNKSEINMPFYTAKNVSGIGIEGTRFPVKDNDYLATFTSFTEGSVPAFLRAPKPVATAVTIDKYTSINISEGMAAILKKTYKTRRNGKPSRRARKQKEQIEKWKKADNDYFNQNSTNNPLDPVDLGDFILYK